MKDYCNCGFRRIEETFLSGGIVYCVDCRQPLCCDVVQLDYPTVAPHPAEVFLDEGHIACWAHLNSVVNLTVSSSIQ